MGPTSGKFDQATQNWVSAVRMYRMSVDLYSRVLQQTRGGRGAIVDERHNLHAPPISDGTAAELPGRTAGSSAFDELTPRELDVARFIAQGYTNQQIAAKLVITRGTAANHVAHILQKLGVANRTQVAAAVLTIGTGSGAGPLNNGDGRGGSVTQVE